MNLTRKEFIATGAGTLALAMSHLAWATEQRFPLAFSTLGCPTWEWQKILSFAETNGFAAIEIRGLLGSMDTPSRPEFATDQIARTKEDIAAHGLKIACVSSSSAMHDKDPAKRAQSLVDAKRFINMAAGLGAPNVRVFGNDLDGPKEEIIAQVASGMHELAAYSEPRGVTVIIESHGDFTDSPTLKQVLTLANSPYAALLWDAHHTFASSHEDPNYTVKELGPWIRHTHLKDSVPSGKERKYVLTGKGDVPVQGAIDALRGIDYKGYYCFEWEKVWHPDLLDPEVAFPDYVRVIRGYLQEPLKKAGS